MSANRVLLTRVASTDPLRFSLSVFTSRLFCCRSLSTSRPSLSSQPGKPGKPHRPTSTVVIKTKPTTFYPHNQLRPDSHKGLEKLNAFGKSAKVRTHADAFRNAVFVGSGGDIENMRPKGRLQEIIVAGRSNTGKSSLLNALLSSSSLVKTSGKAGHTKLLNFFEIPNQMVIVDSPGYGDRGRPEWGELFDYYMTERPPSPPSLLIMLFVLHHSISASDELFLASLPRSLNILPVFTKTDLCPAQEIAERKRKLQNLISAAREAPIGGKQTAGEGGEGPAGKTWEGICVSVKKGWVFRDQTIDAVRSTILSQLEICAKEHAFAPRQPRSSRAAVALEADRAHAATTASALEEEFNQRMREMDNIERFFSDPEAVAADAEKLSTKRSTEGQENPEDADQYDGTRDAWSSRSPRPAVGREDTPSLSGSQRRGRRR